MVPPTRLRSKNMVAISAEMVLRLAGKHTNSSTVVYGAPCLVALEEHWGDANAIAAEIGLTLPGEAKLA